MSIDEVFLHYLKVVGDGEWTLYGVPDDIIQDIKRHERLYAESVEEELVDFAQDVLSQFGYDGRSGGLSTLEYAESLIKRYGKE